MAKSVSSFVQYWDAIKSLLADNENKVLFLRGQSNGEYESIMPGICRKGIIDEQEEYRKIQMDYPEEFSAKAHLSNLVKMQHYGSNTRLLDFTLNPLIALYFAVETDKDKDGKVFAINVDKEKILFQNSDKALMLSCLPIFSRKDQNDIRQFCENHTGEITDQDIVYSNVMRRFLHEIRSEYPAFETAIIGKDLLNYYFICPNKDNERMKSQSGAFAIFGLNEEELTQKITDSATVIEISAQSKEELLRDLDLMKINSSTVYPGIERQAMLNRGKMVSWVKRY